MRHFVIALSLFAASCAGGAPGSPTSPSRYGEPALSAQQPPSVAASHTPSAPTALPFHGSVEATEQDVFTPPDTLAVHITATGTATHLGRYTGRMNGVVNTTTMTSGVGDFTFVAANGDTIFGTSTGQARPGPTPGTVVITEHQTITGGTGRFDGASGSFVIERLFDQTTLASTGSFTGTISFDH